jgi:hypothetical protein
LAVNIEKQKMRFAFFLQASSYQAVALCFRVGFCKRCQSYTYIYSFSLSGARAKKKKKKNKKMGARP